MHHSKGIASKAATLLMFICAAALAIAFPGSAKECGYGVLYSEDPERHRRHDHHRHPDTPHESACFVPLHRDERRASLVRSRGLTFSKAAAAPPLESTEAESPWTNIQVGSFRPRVRQSFWERAAEGAEELARGTLRETPENIARQIHGSVAPSATEMRAMLLEAGTGNKVHYSPDLSEWWGGYSRAYLPDLAQSALSGFADLTEREIESRLGFVRSAELDFRGGFDGGGSAAAFSFLGALRETETSAIAWQFRGFASVEDEKGFNLGALYRVAAGEEQSAMIGANTFIDFASKPETGGFWRASGGVEFRTAWADFHANKYFPITSPLETASGGLEYSAEGHDFALHLHSPRAKWLSGSLTRYQWLGENGDEDEEGVKYALRLRPSTEKNEFLFEIEYDQPAEGAGKFGWRVGYRRHLGGENAPPRDAEAFRPRDHFYESARRNYSQRIRASRNRSGKTADIRIENILFGKIALESSGGTVMISRNGNSGAIEFTRDGEQSEVRPGFSFRYSFPRNEAAMLQLAEQGGIPSATLVFNNSDFLGMRGETSANLTMEGQRLVLENGDIYFHRPSGRYFSGLTAQTFGGGATVGLSRSGVEFEARKFFGGGLSLTLFAGRVDADSPSFSGGMSCAPGDGWQTRRAEGEFQTFCEGDALLQGGATVSVDADGGFFSRDADEAQMFFPLGAGAVAQIESGTLNLALLNGRTALPATLSGGEGVSAGKIFGEYQLGARRGEGRGRVEVRIGALHFDGKTVACGGGGSEQYGNFLIVPAASCENSFTQFGETHQVELEPGYVGTGFELPQIPGARGFTLLNESGYCILEGGEIRIHRPAPEGMIFESVVGGESEVGGFPFTITIRFVVRDAPDAAESELAVAPDYVGGVGNIPPLPKNADLGIYSLTGEPPGFRIDRASGEVFVLSKLEDARNYPVTIAVASMRNNEIFATITAPVNLRALPRLDVVREDASIGALGKVAEFNIPEFPNAAYSLTDAEGGLGLVGGNVWALSPLTTGEFGLRAEARHPGFVGGFAMTASIRVGSEQTDVTTPDKKIVVTEIFDDDEVETLQPLATVAHNYDGVVAEFRAQTAETLTFLRLPNNSPFVLREVSASRFALAARGALPGRAAPYHARITARAESPGHTARDFVLDATITALTARALSVAAVNAGRQGIVLTFGDSDVSGLDFASSSGDAGIAVSRDGNVLLSSPAVAGEALTLLAGATGPYLGTLYFSASITVRKVFGGDEVSGLSPTIKVADGYGGALSTIEAGMADATLTFGGLFAGLPLTLVSLSANRVALSVSGGRRLVGDAEYELAATLTVSANGYQSRAFTLSAVVKALAKRSIFSRILNPGHPAETLTTLQAEVSDDLLAPLTFRHLGDGTTLTIHSGGEVALLAPAIASMHAAVSTAATSGEFLGEMLFTVSVTVRRNVSLALDDTRLTAAPNYVGPAHQAQAVNVPVGATPAYRLAADASGRFALAGDVLRAETALSAGTDYTVTLEVRTEAVGANAAGQAEAAIEVAVLTARGLFAATLNPGRQDVALAFRADEVSGLRFSYVEGDAGVTVLRDGKVSLSSPAVADSSLTLLAGATGSYLGTLYFSASITVRKAFGGDEVSGLSPTIKVADGYGGVLSTLEAGTTDATLTFGRLSAGLPLTLVPLSANRIALSVSGGRKLVGGAKYELAAMLTVSANGYQSRAFTLSAVVKALAKRSVFSRTLNPGHPAETLTTLRAEASDNLLAPLAFRYLGDGTTLTIHSGGEVALLSPAVASTHITVSASATSGEFLGEMLFTVSVTVRRDTSLALDDTRLTAAPNYVGPAHQAQAVNVPVGATPAYRLAADSSGRFALSGDVLRAETALSAGTDYTVTLEVRTEAVGANAAGRAEAAIEVAVLTARGLFAATLNPGRQDVALAFRADEVSGLRFSYVEGDAGVTVLRDGKVSLSSSAVADSSLTLLAGATGSYLGTLYFSASITVRKAFGGDEVSGLSPTIKVVDDYGGALSTIEAGTADATLTFGGLSAGLPLTLISLSANRVALSVSGGRRLVGDAEYEMVATLTVSANGYQSRAFTLSAVVKALAKRSVFSRTLNPGHPAETLTTLRAEASDNLLAPLAFRYLGDGTTLTIYSGGEVALLSPAVASTHMTVSAAATSGEFLGEMLFTISVTIRANTSLSLNDAQYRTAPDYIGAIHSADATGVPDGAAPIYRLGADSSGRFGMSGNVLRALSALSGGADYTVTIEVETGETQSNEAGLADAAVEVSALTARAVSAAVVNAGRRDVVLTFGDADVSGLDFVSSSGDAGVAVLRDGRVSLSFPAVSGAALTVRAGATGDYLGTLYFSASITVRKAFGGDEVYGLSPTVKVADDYGGALSTIEAGMADATLTFGGLFAGLPLTLVSLSANRVALSVSGGRKLVGDAEYELVATLIVSANGYQSRAFTLSAVVKALAKRSVFSRILNPGHPAETLTTLRAEASDNLLAPLTFRHLGDGVTLTIHSGGEVALLAPAVASTHMTVSALATSGEFLGEMLFTVSVTIRANTSLSLNDAQYRTAPDYTGAIHSADATGVPDGAVPTYRLGADSSGRFGVSGNVLLALSALSGGADYTVTIEVETGETQSSAAGFAGAAVEVSALTARAVSAAVVNAERRDVVLTFGDVDVSGLDFVFSSGDAGVAVLRDGRVSLSSPAVAGAALTVRAGATGDYLGTLYFSASITVRKVFGGDEVSGLSPVIKVADNYGGALSTIEAGTADATLTFGGLSAGLPLTLVPLSANRIALSVSGGRKLAGDAEYELAATLTVSANGYQSRAFTLSAVVKALAKRSVFSRILNPVHPAETLTTLQAEVSDNLLAPLAFRHLGGGTTLTINSGGEVALLAPAVASTHITVSASATSGEFLGEMLFTISVTVRRNVSLALDDTRLTAAPNYVGPAHQAQAVNVPVGATPAYRLAADSSGRFALAGDVLRAETALSAGTDYTVTLEVRTEAVGANAAGQAEAAIEVAVLTVRGLFAATLNPGRQDVALTFRADEVSGLRFSYVEGDAGVTVLQDGKVSLSSPAVADSSLTLLAGATGSYLGTLYFSASITVRKAFGGDEVSGLSPTIKVANDYGGALSTIEAGTADATLTFGGLSAGLSLTLVSLSASRVALSVSGGRKLVGDAEYELAATLTVSANGYQSRAFTLSAVVKALAKRFVFSRTLNPGHPAETLTTLQAEASDSLLAPLAFRHLGDGATLTIHSGGEVALLTPAVASTHITVSASATSGEFLGEMLFTVSVTVRRNVSLALDNTRLTAAPNYVGPAHQAQAVNVPAGATPAYRLAADASGRFALAGDVLRVETALSAGTDYTVTLEVRTEAIGANAAGRAEAAIEVAVLTARGLFAATLNPGRQDVALTFRADEVSGLRFSYVEGDAGVTVLQDGKVSLSSPAVADSSLTLLAGATGSYLGTLYFSASITVRKAFGGDEVSGLSPTIKVADDYGGALSTIEAGTADATLTFGGLSAGLPLTLVPLSANRAALSVSGGRKLAGDAEYELAATLIVSANDYQSRAFTLSAVVKALAKRSIFSRILNPNHPAETLTTLRAEASDSLLAPLAFRHLGDGTTLTIHSGGEVALLAPAIASTHAAVSAAATSGEFLGEMLFTISVTVRRNVSLALDDARLTAAPNYVGPAHQAQAVNVPVGATPAYRLAADSSGRFALARDVLRAETALSAGTDYTVTLEVRTEAVGANAAGRAEAAIEVAVLTARGLFAATLNPGRQDVALAFRADEVSGLRFSYVEGDAGVTVLQDGKVSLSSPAVADSSLTLLAGATGSYLGTLYFSASITVRKAFGNDEVSGLSPTIKVADDYGGALSTIEAGTADATLTFGGLSAGLPLTLVPLSANQIALSVSGGWKLVGDAAYELAATLTVSANGYQSRAFTLSAVVKVLAKRSVFSRILNPDHPAETLTTLQAEASDSLLAPLTFRHLGDGTTLTIHSGGEVALLSPAVASTHITVSASATSGEFLGEMLFTISVTIRANTSLSFNDAQYRTAPDYIGAIHSADATGVPDGAAPTYRLGADSSGRFGMSGNVLRALSALSGGADYTVTIEVETGETQSNEAGLAGAAVEVSALTARAVSAAVVNAGRRDVVLTFGDVDVSGLDFVFSSGDAGVAVLRDGRVSLSSPAVAGAALTVRAGATGNYLGTLYFSASITVRKAFGGDEVSGLSPTIKVADGYGGVLSTLEAGTADATLTFGGLSAGLPLTLVSLSENRVALSVSGGRKLVGDAEYELAATLIVSANGYQSRMFTLSAVVEALAKRSIFSRILNPGHPAETLTTLQAEASDGLLAPLTFRHLGDGTTLTIHSGGEVALPAPAVASAHITVSASAISGEFLGGMLFTVSVTVRRNVLLALDDTRLIAAPNYAGSVHQARAMNVPVGASPAYRLIADSSGRFALAGDVLRAETALLAGTDYTVTLEVRTEAVGANIAGRAEAAVEVAALTTRELFAATLNPGRQGVALRFRADEVSGLRFSYVEGDSGVTVLQDGKVSLSSPAVADSSLTLMAGAAGPYLGTLYFSASITVRKAFGGDEVSGLSPTIKVADDYGGALSTIETRTADATLTFGGLPVGLSMTLVPLSANQIALSVSGGRRLAGDAEYGLTATLTVSAGGYQSREFTLFAKVTALAKRGVFERTLNPGHPAEVLTVLSTLSGDALSSPLTFFHLGGGATLTVHADGRLELLSAAVAEAEITAAAEAWSDEFLGRMLFAASVTVRGESGKILPETFAARLAAAGHLGEVYTIAATPESGATVGFHLVGESARFAAGERDGVVRATVSLIGGDAYTATIAAISGETPTRAGARETATLEIVVLTARAVSLAKVNPGARESVLTFALEGAENVAASVFFETSSADGLTVFADGEVSLTLSAASASVYAATALAVSPGFAGTMMFFAEVTTRAAVPPDSLLPQYPLLRAAPDYSGVVLTIASAAPDESPPPDYALFGEGAFALESATTPDNTTAGILRATLALTESTKYSATVVASVGQGFRFAAVSATAIVSLAVLPRPATVKKLNAEQGETENIVSLWFADYDGDRFSGAVNYAILGEHSTLTIMADGEVRALSPLAHGRYAATAVAESPDILGRLTVFVSIVAPNLASDSVYLTERSPTILAAPDYVGNIYRIVAANTFAATLTGALAGDSDVFTVTGEYLMATTALQPGAYAATISLHGQTREGVFDRRDSRNLSVTLHISVFARAGLTMLAARPNQGDSAQLAIADYDENVLFATDGGAIRRPDLEGAVFDILADGLATLHSPASAYKFSNADGVFERGTVLTLAADATGAFLGTMRFSVAASVGHFLLFGAPNDSNAPRVFLRDLDDRAYVHSAEVEFDPVEDTYAAKTRLAHFTYLGRRRGLHVLYRLNEDANDGLRSFAASACAAGGWSGGQYAPRAHRTDPRQTVGYWRRPSLSEMAGIMKSTGGAARLVLNGGDVSVPGFRNEMFVQLKPTESGHAFDARPVLALRGDFYSARQHAPRDGDSSPVIGEGYERGEALGIGSPADLDLSLNPAAAVHEVCVAEAEGDYERPPDLTALQFIYGENITMTSAVDAPPRVTATVWIGGPHFTLTARAWRFKTRFHRGAENHLDESLLEPEEVVRYELRSAEDLILSTLAADNFPGDATLRISWRGVEDEKTALATLTATPEFGAEAVLIVELTAYESVIPKRERTPTVYAAPNYDADGNAPPTAHDGVYYRWRARSASATLSYPGAFAVDGGRATLEALPRPPNRDGFGYRDNVLNNPANPRRMSSFAITAFSSLYDSPREMGVTLHVDVLPPQPVVTIAFPPARRVLHTMSVLGLPPEVPVQWEKVGGTDGGRVSVSAGGVAMIDSPLPAGEYVVRLAAESPGAHPYEPPDGIRPGFIGRVSARILVSVAESSEAIFFDGKAMFSPDDSVLAEDVRDVSDETPSDASADVETTYWGERRGLRVVYAKTIQPERRRHFAGDNLCERGGLAFRRESDGAGIAGDNRKWRRPTLSETLGILQDGDEFVLDSGRAPPQGSHPALSIPGLRGTLRVSLGANPKTHEHYREAFSGAQWADSGVYARNLQVGADGAGAYGRVFLQGDAPPMMRALLDLADADGDSDAATFCVVESDANYSRHPRLVGVETSFRDRYDSDRQCELSVPNIFFLCEDPTVVEVTVGTPHSVVNRYLRDIRAVTATVYLYGESGKTVAVESHSAEMPPSALFTLAPSADGLGYAPQFQSEWIVEDGFAATVTVLFRPEFGAAGALL